MRLFVAIHLPDEVRERVQGLQEHLGALWPDIKWIPPEKMHVTLSFLGQVDEERAPELGEALMWATERCRPFRLAVAGMGAFDSVRKPRVLWAGLSGDLEGLQQLQSRVNAAVSVFHGIREVRGFQPHVTLTRVRKQALPGLKDEVGKVGHLGAWNVDRIWLVRSKLSPKGSTYSNLAEFPLQETCA